MVEREPTNQFARKYGEQYRTSEIHFSVFQRTTSRIRKENGGLRGIISTHKFKGTPLQDNWVHATNRRKPDDPPPNCFASRVKQMLRYAAIYKDIQTPAFPFHWNTILN